MIKENRIVGIVCGFLKMLLMAYIISGLFIMLLAFLLYKFRLPDELVNIGIIVIYCVSNFLTGFLAGKSKKTKKFLWGFGIGCLYFGLLTVISLVFGESVAVLSNHFLTTYLLCIGCGMLGGMLA